MDEKTVTSVLNECGNNIDAAIRRLGDLRLSNEEQAAAAASTATPDVGGAEPGGAGPATRAADPQPGTPSTPAAGPQTGDQWVDFLVQEMAAAKDILDARSRAANVLQHFERFVTTKTEAKLGKVTDLHKENTILKRAVQLQHTKLQEKSQQEQEVQQLRQMVSQYQEQLRTLEMNNYSLALHLQKATNNSPLPGQHNPDIY